MTQELYQKAIKFAAEKHDNQKVPGTNANYLSHNSNVAMEILLAFTVEADFDLNHALQMALLHDTLEDTETNIAELSESFGERVALGVQALTKNERLGSKIDQMTDSLHRIKELEKEVAMVKLADRITNLQEPPKYWKKDKINHYLKEAALIDELLVDTPAYLNNRLRSKMAAYQKYAE